MASINLSLYLLLFIFCFYPIHSLFPDLSFNQQLKGIERYSKLEVSFSFNGNISNPFDPDEISADLTVYDEHSSLIIPCFYFVPVDWVNNTYGHNYKHPVVHYDLADWRCRFTPSKAASYSLFVTLSGSIPSVRSKTYQINVIHSSLTGFVRRDPKNLHSLIIENKPYSFFPIGINVAWNDDGSLVAFYQHFLSSLGKYNVTWVRYWLTQFARQEIESVSNHWSGFYQGLGRYSAEGSSMLDLVLDMAEKEGVYIQLCITQHGLWSLDVDSNWRANPYNIDNGGMLSTPAALFRDNDAIRFQKRRYRYLVARYAYSTHLFSWEHFNEVNFAGCYPRPCEHPIIFNEVVSWHQIMSDYLAQIDPFHHLVTTSVSGEDALLIDLNAITSMTQLQYHCYFDHGIDILTYAINLESPGKLPNQNLILGEYGERSHKYNMSHPDKHGDHVRRSTWLGFMAQIPTQFWYWTYIEGFNLYSLWGPFAQFIEKVDFTEDFLKTKYYELTGCDNCDLYSLTSITASQIFLFVIDRSYGEWSEVSVLQNSTQIKLDDLHHGQYSIQFFHPSNGVVATPLKLEISTNDFLLKLPDWHKDIGIKIVAHLSRSSNLWLLYIIIPSSILAAIIIVVLVMKCRKPSQSDYQTIPN